MELLTTPDSMRLWRRARRATLGFVPTMGYLHDGHLSLAHQAKVANDLVAVSIFVNPTQFGPGEDFERYPRDEERDLRLLREAGVDAVYMPSPATMYPDGYQTYVDVERVTKPLEGAARPGHFRGVTTVVLKLFNTVEPTRAYFGRKDAQQLRVLRRMTRDLDLGVEIVACPIVREPDGLAMSSRNVYLTPEQRQAATVLQRALQQARASFEDGVRDPDVLRGMVQRQIADEPLAVIDYISLADDDTLEELDSPLSRPALLSLVVRFGKTRLLDNVELG
jgi:pantoate--beta-alanine ligase